MERVVDRGIALADMAEQTRPVILEFHYAQSGDARIAYQVLGDGDLDLAFSYGFASNIEIAWEEPSFARFLRRLGSFSRLIWYDRRGSGLSDRVSENALPTLEERVDDLLAVLDAVGSERAAVFGLSEAGMISTVFAATHPERCTGLVLYGTPARMLWDDEHPWGMQSRDVFEQWLEAVAPLWGTYEGAQAQLGMWGPSMVGDRSFTEWLARYRRHSLSPGALRSFARMMIELDITDVLPSIRVPTLVLQRAEDLLVHSSLTRFVADRIPGAKYVEVPGVDHFPFVGDQDTILDEIEEFLTGNRRGQMAGRKLAAILVIDIVGSSRQAEALRDDRWAHTLEVFHDVVREQVRRYQGVLVSSRDDEILATFDGPARAVQCALVVSDLVAHLGVDTRAGVHAGECTIMGDAVGGIAVHTAARISESAAPGEIVASSTIKDLIAGSGILFGEPRTVALKGLSETRVLYPVIRDGAPPKEIRRAAIAQEHVFRRQGEYWVVAYDGQVASLKDSKGMNDLARLIKNSDREFHVIDLVMPNAPRVAGGVHLGRDELERAGILSGEPAEPPVLDDAARAAYQRRLLDLKEELAEAEQVGDVERIGKLKEEIDLLTEELTSAYGLAGRPRRLGPDPAERARKAVTKRIHDAIGRIERQHPSLGRHLRVSVKTGTFCSYAPDRAPDWQL